MRRVAVTTAALALLGCSGLLPSNTGPQGIPDHLVGIEQARQEGRFAGAEEKLRRYLMEQDEDIAAWQMMGDLQITRGQKNKQKWKENLVRARDAYREGVIRRPEDCTLWSRLGMALSAGKVEAETQVDQAFLTDLPLAQGWEACADAPEGLLLVVDSVQVSSDADEQVRKDLGSRPTREEVRAAAVPGLREAFARVDSSSWEWQSIEHPPARAGQPFVIFAPTTARGLNDSPNRSIRTAEDVTAASVGSKEVEFIDRRDPATNTRHAYVKAPACGETSWRLGSDRRPLGTCRSGPVKTGLSPVYSATTLRKTNQTHFVYESIAPAILSANAWIEDSLTCTGGTLGPMFVDVPSCSVTYSEPSARRRAVSKAAGLAAFDEQHADGMVQAWRMRAVLGDELADRLAKGELAVGMPYALFVYALGGAEGCSARGLMNHSAFVDGGLQQTCRLYDVDYHFQELKLVSATPAR